LLLSELVVALTPQGIADVDVTSLDAGGASIACQISNGNPSVASVTLDGATLHITGLSSGTTNVTVTNGRGGRRVLPVQVYDPLLLDTGELVITYTNQFEPVWSQSSDTDLSFWKPVPPEGFYALGTYCQSPLSDPSGYVAVMVVAAKPGSDAIAFATSFDSYYSQIHTPIPPTGYKALGNVFTAPDQTPELLACLREDLTVRAEPGGYAWYDPTGWTGEPESISMIVQRHADTTHEGAYLVPGTFIFWFGAGAPVLDHPVLNILNVELPMLAQAEDEEFSPRMTSRNRPPNESSPKMQRAMLVPCTMIRDMVPGHDIGWQGGNSPFYRLDREIYYRCVFHQDNATSQPQPSHYDESWGITTEMTNSVWSDTQISLSVDFGLSFRAVDAGISATVSQSFGYETQTSVGQLAAGGTTAAITVPAQRAAALWQQYDRYRLYRHNGNTLELVKTWEFGIESFVSDQYPDD